MRKIINITVVILSLYFVACDDVNLPKASLNLMEVSSIVATPADMEVRLDWTPMEGANPTEYFLTWTPTSATLEGGEISLEAGSTSYVVSDLVNGETYTFYIQAVYGNEGRSGKISVRTRPITSRPAPTSFTAIPGNTSVELKWIKPDNNSFTEYRLTVSPSDEQIDISGDLESLRVTGLNNDVLYTFEMVAVYPNGLSEIVNTTATPSEGPIDFLWSSIELKYGGFSGYVKVSNPVFSPDGNTIYLPTSTPNGHLFAIDRLTGVTNWVFQIPTITYGGGAIVGNDGTIYQSGTDRKVYAINPTDGSLKWNFDVDGVIGAFPALSTDGILYCVTNGSTLYAINTNSGTMEWSQSLNGATGSAVAIDDSGNIYVGTSSYIVKYNTMGEKQWETSALNVTERGSFAINGTTLYAALKAGEGVAAVDMTDGTVNWNYANGNSSDAYFPIVGTDGTIFFNEKGGDRKVYAINPNGTLKWSTEIGAAMNYCGMALSDEGKLYGGTQGKIEGDFQVFEIDAATGNKSVLLETDQQIMSATTIGPDKRVYQGTIRASSADDFGKLFAIPINGGLELNSWSMRGKNAQGTSR